MLLLESVSLIKIHDAMTLCLKRIFFISKLSYCYVIGIKCDSRDMVMEVANQPMNPLNPILVHIILCLKFEDAIIFITKT